jgi:hypothetical protein
MAKCCEDPTEPNKIDPRVLLREQKRYDDLMLDLVTENPEKVLLKHLHEASVYLKELAALRAFHPSVRLHAIQLLNKHSETVLNQIIEREPDSEIGQAAKFRLEHINDGSGLIGRLFRSS